MAVLLSGLSVRWPANQLKCCLALPICFRRASDRDRVSSGDQNMRCFRVVYLVGGDGIEPPTLSV